MIEKTCKLDFYFYKHIHYFLLLYICILWSFNVSQPYFECWDLMLSTPSSFLFFVALKASISCAKSLCVYFSDQRFFCIFIIPKLSVTFHPYFSSFMQLCMSFPLPQINLSQDSSFAFWYSFCNTSLLFVTFLITFGYSVGLLRCFYRFCVFLALLL